MLMYQSLYLNIEVPGKIDVSQLMSIISNHVGILEYDTWRLLYQPI